ncbi:hypothetical protein CAPTEDRAFT_167590 [Capitella teleta]|uniref:Uncharacterized protein n=1 Tax=Capitella teleta TaxID=283909 RepID=X1ZB38_CAPTE|nr:hypothetical protein CAPTEDRAFT_167590 [Capitella teleta]|eukprot:ELU10162.1 hypothetical protein CAPTEDRAFT_167590 [Capitella teleta]
MLRSPPPSHSAEQNSSIDQGFDLPWEDGRVDKRYECPICLLVQRNPVQTSCGHRYCRACIYAWIRESPLCPTCNSALGTSKMFTDLIAEREIMSLRVKCSNEGCTQTFELANSESHNEKCLFRLVPCPNGCPNLLRRRSLDNHMANLCLLRVKVCEHCSEEVKAEDLPDHLNKCRELQISCELCGCRVQRSELMSHRESVCAKVIIPCCYSRFGCTERMQRQNLPSHYAACVHEHLQLVSQHVSILESQMRPSVASHRPASARLPQQLSFDSPYVTSDLIDTDPIKTAAPGGTAALLNEASDLAAQLVDAKRTIERLTSTVQQQTQKISSLERKIREIDGRHCNGVFYWQVNNYMDYKQTLLQGSTPVLHSPGFYSSFYGYKMCIRLNPNGIEQGSGTHVSVFLHFMKGENDALLRWPFKGKIVLSILDLISPDGCQQHIVDFLSSKPDLAAFRRPTSNRNHKGFGYLEFAPISVIEKGNYVKDNTLVVKAVIECEDESLIA